VTLVTPPDIGRYREVVAQWRGPINQTIKIAIKARAFAS